MEYKLYEFLYMNFYEPEKSKEKFIKRLQRGIHIFNESKKTDFKFGDIIVGFGIYIENRKKHEKNNDN